MKIKYIVPAMKQAWHLNRGDLLAFGFAITVVVVAGFIGTGPFWLVAALVGMQLVNAGRVVTYRARAIAEAEAFLDYIRGLDGDELLSEFEAEWAGEPDGEAADL